LRWKAVKLRAMAVLAGKLLSRLKSLASQIVAVVLLPFFDHHQD